MLKRDFALLTVSPLARLLPCDLTCFKILGCVQKLISKSLFHFDLNLVDMSVGGVYSLNRDVIDDWNDGYREK